MAFLRSVLVSLCFSHFAVNLVQVGVFVQNIEGFMACGFENISNSICLPLNKVHFSFMKDSQRETYLGRLVYSLLQL